MDCDRLLFISRRGVAEKKLLTLIRYVRFIYEDLNQSIADLIIIPDSYALFTVHL